MELRINHRMLLTVQLIYVGSVTHLFCILIILVQYNVFIVIHGIFHTKDVHIGSNCVPAKHVARAVCTNIHVVTTGGFRVRIIFPKMLINVYLRVVASVS